ncbi:MAG TPA: peptidase T [Pirellulaceae bacterium]|nr:peptidase T [Pirellulaceae bacterium]
MINHARLLERFLRYVQIDTTAGAPGGDYPSSPGQWTYGKLLVDELHALGIKDATQDEHGLVLATVPATIDRKVPVVAFNAHLDTSPETSGTNVKPQVLRSYIGGDIILPADPSQVIRVANNPELKELVGKTLITTDGTTLLGADDKSGIAVIMELAATLVEHPELPHGPVRLLFTCDEEIGHGVDHVDLQKVAATVCYTLDGAGANEIDTETFSADGAVVKFRGANIHPSIAKGRMVNAIRAAGEFVARLPRATLAPETTEDRQGFLHPYGIEGGVAEASVKFILRDFDTPALTAQADLLRSIGKQVELEFPGLTVIVETYPQYRNLGDGLKQEPRAVSYAIEAHRKLGREPKLSIIRGGTDGSHLTAHGLPTPNLSTGEHNPHSPLEFTCLEEMVAATKVLVELVQVWAKP